MWAHAHAGSSSIGIVRDFPPHGNHDHMSGQSRKFGAAGIADKKNTLAELICFDTRRTLRRVVAAGAHRQHRFAVRSWAWSLQSQVIPACPCLETPFRVRPAMALAESAGTSVTSALGGFPRNPVASDSGPAAQKAYQTLRTDVASLI